MRGRGGQLDHAASAARGVAAGAGVAGAHYPDRAARIMARLRDMQGGQDYDPDWGTQDARHGPYAQMVAQRFDIAAQAVGAGSRAAAAALRSVSPPARAGEQMQLF